MRPFSQRLRRDGARGAKSCARFGELYLALCSANAQDPCRGCDRPEARLLYAPCDCPGRSGRAAFGTGGAVRTGADSQSCTAEDKTQVFEVASIKTNQTRTDSRGISVQPGPLTITGLTVREIVAFAYGIRTRFASQESPGARSGRTPIGSTLRRKPTEPYQPIGFA